MSRDLMHSAELKEIVRTAYREATGSSREVAQRLYAREELEAVPATAADRALGVGNHLRFSPLEPGDTVLDLGCGAGIDTILAARRVGPDGRVLALDFLPEMLERTSTAATEAGLANVRTIEGEIEDIPLADGAVDRVISNGVLNLSPRKARALAESFRVLRPGGTFWASDLTVVEDELPPPVLTHPAAWAG